MKKETLSAPNQTLQRPRAKSRSSYYRNRKRNRQRARNGITSEIEADENMLTKKRKRNNSIHNEEKFKQVEEIIDTRENCVNVRLINKNEPDDKAFSQCVRNLTLDIYHP